MLQFGLMIAVVAGRPDWPIVNTLYIVFAGLFASEHVIKLAGLGLSEYASNFGNIYDLMLLPPAVLVGTLDQAPPAKPGPPTEGQHGSSRTVWLVAFVLLLLGRAVRLLGETIQIFFHSGGLAAASWAKAAGRKARVWLFGARGDALGVLQGRGIGGGSFRILH